MGFWDTPEKVLNLTIGKVSESTIQHNFPMIEREYQLIIQPMYKKIKSLNRDLLVRLKHEIARHVFHLDAKYRIEDPDDRYRRYERSINLTKAGDKEYKRLLKAAKLPKQLIDEDVLLQNIQKIEDELKQLREDYIGCN